MKRILLAALTVISMAPTWADTPMHSTPESRAAIFRPQNLSCGIPPIPPVGCRVGSCTCDQNGSNCRWNFICG